MTTPVNIDYNGIRLTSLDETKNITMSMEGNSKGLELQYDINSAVKKFSITSDGVNWNDGTSNYTTGLSRLALVQTVLSSLELPPDSSTLAINKNIQLNYTNDNNIILDEANNNFVIPVSNPKSELQTRITKNNSDVLNIATLNDISFTKNFTPTYDINNLQVTTSTLGTVPQVATTNLTVRAVFPNSNKLLYAVTDTTTFTKNIFVQNFGDSNFTTVNLTSLTTGASSYLGNLSVISVAQFIPVYYNSQIDCKFFIRLSENNNVNNFYIITCQGDPTLLSSYTYSPNYLLTSATSFTGINAAYRKNNGESWDTLANLTIATAVSGHRISVLLYNQENDLFVCSNQPTVSPSSAQCIVIIRPSLQQGVVYNHDVSSLGLAQLSRTFSHGHVGTNILSFGFNNGMTNYLRIQLVNFDVTNKTLVFSGFKDTFVDIPSPSQYVSEGYAWDTFIVLENGLYYFYYMYVNNTDVNNRVIHMARYSWDGIINTSPVYISNSAIQNVLNTTLTSTTAYSLNGVYYSIRAYNTTNFEIFSSWGGVSGTNSNGTLYITDNNFTSSRVVSVTNILSAANWFVQVENDTLTRVLTNFAVIYPQHYMMRAAGFQNSTANTIDFRLINVTNPTGTVQNYMSLSHNTSTSSTNQTYSFPTTITASDLTFTSLPKCSSVPSNNNDLTNKLYVDGLSSNNVTLSGNQTITGLKTFSTLPESSIVPTTNNQLTNKSYVDSLISAPPSLSAVLLTGNSAGTTDINVNSNDLLNVSSITSTADLLLNPVGSVDLNGKNLNMTGGEIHNIDLLHSQNNLDMIIEGKGTGDIILKTNNVNQVTIADNGIATFTSLPECSVVPTTSNQLINKTYADGLLTNAVTLSGTQTITGNKTITGSLNIVKLVENTQAVTGAATITIDYSTISGSTFYIAAPPNSNFTLNLTNVPVLSTGVYTITLLMSSGTNKVYVTTFNLNGSAQTLRYNGGVGSINISSASFVLQTFTIVYSGGTVQVVLTAVSGWS